VKPAKVVLWTVLIVGGVLAFSLYTMLSSTHTVDEMREHLDTTYFTGKHPGYEPVVRAAMMKTTWYQKFLTVKTGDSLHIYIKLAEKEGMEAVGIK
jgi:hypothetical protein